MFVEAVKNKIRTSTLAEHKNDIPGYQRFLTNNLRVITSMGVADNVHNDLIPHIFLQLRTTTIPIFQPTIIKWQRNYMESSLKLTPIKLVTLADEECQVLKHFGQWVETIDPSIVAMQALLQSTTQGTAKVFKELTANLSKLSSNQTLNHNGQGWHREVSSGNSQQHQEDQHRHYMSDSPDWVYEKPSDAHETQTYRGKIWSFCPKCGHNGKWVCTHTATTHRLSEFLHQKTIYNDDDGSTTRGRPIDRSARGFDNRRAPYYNREQAHSRSRTPPSCSGSPLHNRSRSVSFKNTPPPSPHAKLFLYDEINAFIGADSG